MYWDIVCFVDDEGNNVLIDVELQGGSVHGGEGLVFTFIKC